MKKAYYILKKYHLKRNRIMKDLIILGAGGAAFEIVEIVNSINAIKPEWNIIGYLDDNKQLINTKKLNITILGTISDADKFSDVFFVSSIGHPDRPELRKEVRNRIPFADDRFATIIHPNTVVYDSANIGFGCVIYNNCTISSKSKVGNDVLIAYGSILGHESTIGDNTIVGASVTIPSDVHIGNSVYIGPGVIFKNEIVIGNNVLIGIGSIVIESVGNDKKYMCHIRPFTFPLDDKTPYHFDNFNPIQ
jgi:sugar O-acyltransferase (sialic acid O-acetyltransferase NeuD family)